MPAIVLVPIIGALIGSFLNVVISRGPRAWGLVEAERGPSGLAYPPSQCEMCGRRLGPLELIPIISFIALRGRCRGCGAGIGLRHLIVEGAGAALGLFALWRFGWSWEMAAALALFFPLLALAVIDAETGYLPDALTLPLLVVGLAVSAIGIGPSLLDAVLGAGIGGLGMGLLAFSYRKLRGREGLGGGDVKLVAAGGAWCGAAALPFILLAGSLLGLVFAAAAMAAGRKDGGMQAEIRFGPFLAAAIAAVYAVGPPLMVAS